jgi:hypothetical protein
MKKVLDKSYKKTHQPFPTILGYLAIAEQRRDELEELPNQNGSMGKV